MKGRRSSDQNFVFGYPCEFLGNVFPRENEIVSHAQFLRRHNSSVGVWKQNTPDNPALKISWGPPTANLWPDWSPQQRVNRDKLDQ